MYIHGEIIIQKVTGTQAGNCISNLTFALCKSQSSLQCCLLIFPRGAVVKRHYFPRMLLCSSLNSRVPLVFLFCQGVCNNWILVKCIAFLVKCPSHISSPPVHYLNLTSPIQIGIYKCTHTHTDTHKHYVGCTNRILSIISKVIFYIPDIKMEWRSPGTSVYKV